MPTCTRQVFKILESTDEGISTRNLPYQYQPKIRINTLHGQQLAHVGTNDILDVLTSLLTSPRGQCLLYIPCGSLPILTIKERDVQKAGGVAGRTSEPYQSGKSHHAGGHEYCQKRGSKCWSRLCDSSSMNLAPNPSIVALSIRWCRFKQTHVSYIFDKIEKLHALNDFVITVVPFRNSQEVRLGVWGNKCKWTSVSHTARHHAS